MQLESLMLMLLMIVVMPVMILTSNHNIFFVLIGLVTLLFSFINIFSLFKAKVSSEESEEIPEELESAVNLDVEKLGRGLEFAKSLVIILFFLYCAMFLENSFLKVLPALLISYRVFEVITSMLRKKGEEEAANAGVFRKVIYFCINSTGIAVIVLVAYNKFFNPVF